MALEPRSRLVILLSRYPTLAHDQILTLYAQRPIVEKHTGYAFYRPSSEAIASILTDMPYKMINAFTSNIPLYFMINLRREPGKMIHYTTRQRN
jgi:ABC-type multidrug transport system permease subunit